MVEYQTVNLPNVNLEKWFFSIIWRLNPLGLEIKILEYIIYQLPNRFSTIGQILYSENFTCLKLRIEFSSLGVIWLSVKCWIGILTLFAVAHRVHPRLNKTDDDVNAFKYTHVPLIFDIYK